MAALYCLGSQLGASRPDALAEAALELAQEYQPGIDISHYLRRLRFYAEVVCDRLPAHAPLGDALFTLNDYLFNDRGLHVEFSPRALPESLFLNHVLDTRCGAPLGLALVYLTVGRWLGLPMVAASFPGRILIRYRDEEGDVVIDPADGGMPLQEADLALLFSHSYALSSKPSHSLERFLSATDDRALMMRLLRQLKQIHLQRREMRRALWAQEQLLQLDPDSASGFRDRGKLYELLDCRIAAAEDYARYLELSPDASDAEGLRRRLPALLQRSPSLH